ncbi:hypothetical protein [Janibacter sp. UYMM211]|uniref:hypothetical protein n=1 Tax=Janibacter sp. UYMM211 TaxID=3156342 RepID=UPI0033960BA3
MRRSSIAIAAVSALLIAPGVGSAAAATQYPVIVSGIVFRADGTRAANTKVQLFADDPNQQSLVSDGVTSTPVPMTSLAGVTTDGVGRYSVSLRSEADLNPYEDSDATVNMTVIAYGDGGDFVQRSFAAAPQQVSSTGTAYRNTTNGGRSASGPARYGHCDVFSAIGEGTGGEEPGRGPLREHHVHRLRR